MRAKVKKVSVNFCEQVNPKFLDIIQCGKSVDLGGMGTCWIAVPSTAYITHIVLVLS